MRQPLFLFLATSAFLASPLAARARAGIILDHALVGASAGTSSSGSGTPQQYVGAGVITSGVVSAETHQSNFFVQNFGVLTLPQDLGSQAEAHTGTDAAHLLGSTASALAQPATYGYPFNSAPGGSSAGANSYSAWTDIGYVAGPQHPASINLTFAVTGLLSANQNPVPDHGLSQGIVQVGWASQIFNFATNPSFPQIFHAQGTVGSGAGIVGFTNESIDQAGNFNGTVTFQVNYDASLGGYGFTVTLAAQVTASPVHLSTYATSDFSDTLGLTSVTAADGSPVAVTFDSGMPLASSVPEPSSLAMLGVGLLGAVG